MESVSTEKKLTPMMEQYRSIKKTLPENTILFFRLGDFYEMFFEDAIKAAEILNITLTGREGGEAGRIPMCGIPYHAYQGYLKTLLDHNLKVAVCEQVGEVKAGKGLVERKVSRIVTPATYLEAEDKAARAEYLAAVVMEENSAALAYLDVGTGEFCVRELREERLISELSLLEPRELILARSLETKQELISFVKNQLNASITFYDDWVFEKAEALTQLKNKFRLASDHGISFLEHAPCVRACGALLYYLKDHFHETLEHLQMPRLLQSGDYMVLDRQTQNSLELVSNVSGNRGATLLACLDRTRTSMGSRLLRHWITHPLLSVTEISRRQEAAAELISDTSRAKRLQELLEGIKDIERTLSRLNYGVANARDLLNLKFFLERVPALQEVLLSCQAALIEESNRALKTFPELQELISRAIVDEPPLAVKDGGIIRDSYDTDLDELRDISRGGKSWILSFQQKEIERTGIKTLKVKYSQVFGYTIEISNGQLHAVPEDYIRKQTLANGERFIVPELREWDQKISGAEEKIKALEYALFTRVRERVLEDLRPLQEMAQAVGVLDTLQSLAAAAAQKKWIRPQVDESQVLDIKAGRHPVVESMLPYGQFVDNDCLLNTDDHQLMILTGPNMAGKSTYIRQSGLIVLLAQIGSFVPAASARVGLVDRIFTRIGASDNLASGESTFMVEMIETAHILRNATKRSLLILDEVGRGTSTFDGVSIAWAICEYLAKGAMRPRTLFATHYHELIQLETHFPNVRNYNITVKETNDGIVFLRKVVAGGSDRSYGIHVARLAGIPKTVTDRADEILHVLENENIEATQIIEGNKGRIASLPASGGEHVSATPPKADPSSGGEAISQRKSGIASPAKCGEARLPAGKAGNDEGSTQQLSFFTKQEPHPVLEEVQALVLEQVTPIEALNLIASWKKKIGDPG